MMHEWYENGHLYPQYRELAVPPLVLEGADPFIKVHDNSYLLIQSGTPDTHINLRKSTSLYGFESATPNTICAPTNPEYNQMIWAPELQHFDKWYLYFAASDGKNKNHRNYVWYSTDPDPMTPSYEFGGKLCDPDHDFWGIDFTVMNYKDNLYGIWSGWEDHPENVPEEYHFNDHDLQQNLYIGKMSDPQTLSGSRVLLSSPTYGWEKSVAPINEGPQVHIDHDNVELLYSADASWTPQYCMGKLSLRGTDPLDPEAWHKHPTPILQGPEGPGHGMVFNDPIHGNLLTYHRKRNTQPGWDRNIWFKKYVG